MEKQTWIKREKHRISKHRDIRTKWNHKRKRWNHFRVKIWKINSDFKPWCFKTKMWRFGNQTEERTGIHSTTSKRINRPQSNKRIPFSQGWKSWSDSLRSLEGNGNYKNRETSSNGEICLC